MSADLMSCVRENSPPNTMENSGATSLSSESQGTVYVEPSKRYHLSISILQFTTHKLISSDLNRVIFVFLSSFGAYCVDKSTLLRCIVVVLKTFHIQSFEFKVALPVIICVVTTISTVICHHHL